LNSIFFLDVLLNALDINNEAPRHHHDNDNTRARSASSSPRPSLSRQISEINVKPTCLYVSNWTDDEKCRRRNERMKFNEAQLAERFNKTKFLFLYHPIFHLDRILKH